MNIALLGPSGVGKGTHADALATAHDLRHLATGDLFRRNVRDRTALGLVAKKYMAQAELVPDEVVDAMIEEWMDALAPQAGMLFDGFPRTLDQARFLEELLARQQRRFDAAIYLKVDDDTVLERLVGREICRNCQTAYHVRARPPRTPHCCDRCGGELYQRADDNTELARTRLRIFHRMTEPVLEHYAALGKLLVIPGTGSIAEVGERLGQAVRALARQEARFTSRDELRGVAPPAPVTAPVRTLHRAPIDLVLLGGPGSGKGTQAERMSATLHLPHIATGDLFRENLRLATPLGLTAKSYMDRGELVPDEVTDAMIEARLAQGDADDGFILDGYPRSLAQAHALDEILGRLGRTVAAVLHIRVSDASIVERLGGRLTCPKCQAPYHPRFKPPQRAGHCDQCGDALYQRRDDNPETIRARLVTFHRQTEPLIRHYGAAGLLREIDGEQGVDETGRQILATLGPLAVRTASASAEAT